MQIIKQGAEAVLYLSTFENQQVLVKERIKKRYRLNEIDEELRKTRTRKEVRLLTEARKFGVMTPKILHVDETNHKIIMEYIDGKVVRDFLNSADKKDIEKISYEIGKIIGKLHSNGIVHGDLTTSNMILQNNQIYFIDFSLGNFSKRIEDFGTDLKLLQEAVKATHYKIIDLVCKNIIKGYKEEFSYAEKVLERIEEIEGRMRYQKGKRTLKQATK